MSAEELRFDGRVAVVTGGGRGLGRSYALALAARGAAVVVNDAGVAPDGTPEAEALPAHVAAEEITAAGGQAVANHGDVATVDGAESIVQDALHHFGRVDIVIGNAGIAVKSDFPATPLEHLDRHLAVHVGGAFNIARAAWPHMTTQGYGRVVLVTSTALLGIGGGFIAYGTAKGGVYGLGRMLAQAGQDIGIKVNMVAPIAFTRLTPTATLGEDAIRERSRSLSPDRVAPVVAALAHEACPTTGEVIFAAADRVARIFMAETVGYRQVEMSAEDVLANWAAIVDETGFTIPEFVEVGASSDKAAAGTEAS